MKWITYTKLALKTLWSNKFFAFMSVVGVAVTILLLMLASIQWDNAISPKAPEVNLDRTLIVKRVKLERGNDNTWMSGVGRGLIGFITDSIKSAQTVSVFMSSELNITMDKGTSQHSALMVDPNFWQIHQFEFMDGRPFTQAEYDAKAQVVVINQNVNRILFGEESGVGKTMVIRGQVYTVIGVVADISITCHNAYAEAWAPLSLVMQRMNADYLGSLSVLYLAKSKADFSAIKSEVKEAERKINTTLEKDMRLYIAGPDTSFEAHFRGYGDPEEFNGAVDAWIDIITRLLILMIIPTINLIALNLTRIDERKEEIAVRKSFGASRWVIVRQLLYENIVVCFIGGVIGLLVSIWCAYAFSELLFEPSWNQSFGHVDVHFSPYVFIGSLVFVFILGILSGIVPAYKTAKQSPALALKGGEQ